MLAEWLSIAADIASLGALISVWIVGRIMHRHHINDNRHVKENDSETP